MSGVTSFRLDPELLEAVRNLAAEQQVYPAAPSGSVRERPFQNSRFAWKAALSRSRDTARAMSQENFEIVRRFFDSYQRHDPAEALACLAPDVIYEVGQEVPAQGRQEVRAMWERWESAWDEIEMIPEEFIEAGKHVIVAVHYLGRGRGSGIDFDARTFDVYTLRDGLCVRKLEFNERSDALEAAGLSE